MKNFQIKGQLISGKSFVKDFTASSIDDVVKHIPNDTSWYIIHVQVADKIWSIVRYDHIASFL